MADFWDSLLNGVISAAPGVLGTVLGSNAQTDANSAAAAQKIAGANLAAQIMGAGYDRSWDAQTGALNNVVGDQQQLYGAIKPLYAAIPGQVTQGLTDAARAYQTNLRGNVDSAGSYYLPSAGDYAAQLLDAGSGYAGDMAKLAGGIYSPYADAGKAALANLQAIAGTNPSMLTPAQQQARDDFIRQSEGSLAASGLRGSARAQAAVLDRGLTNLEAQSYAQNQSRADQANQLLLQSGLLGSNALMTAGTEGNQALLSAANQGAANLNALRTRLGDYALQTGLLGSQAMLNAQNRGVDASTNAANNLIAATQQYLGNKAATDYARGQLDVNNIMGKAGTAAGAAQGDAVTNAAATAANGANWGGAINTLGGIISSNLKNAIMPSGYRPSGGSGGSSSPGGGGGVLDESYYD